MASPQQQRYALEDPGVPQTAREAREAARAAARNGSGSRYRRPQSQSPDFDDDLYSGHGESRSPTSDVALHDVAHAHAPQQVRHFSAKHIALPLFPSLTYVQQRVVPAGYAGRNGDQRRPPSASHRGPQPLPASYPGPKGLDSSPRSFASGERSDSRRQSPGKSESEPRTAGSSPSFPRSAPSGSPSRSRGSMQQNRMSQSMTSDGSRQQQRYPPSSRGGLAVSGAEINRVNSPSIQMIVLQPLERKIDEYDLLMREEQANIDHLDAEVRALEERRQRAEERFLEAKAKHDEYERQHQDVSRALQS
ncbi:hypothetical protein QQZ08_005910 [Neonectria magnoliae]|uniref:Uncharacterized protein n=1 Tax=Neonectria magnoliae TaxID=2732573 RepID=A0ABR1I259_9HYPO